MAKDRPGIVAEVTEGIGSLGGNLADLRESVLCGYFTMILNAGFPQEVSVEQVEKILAEKTVSNVSVALHKGGMTESENIENAYVLSAVGRRIDDLGDQFQNHGGTADSRTLKSSGRICVF